MGDGWDFQQSGLPKALQGGGSMGCESAFCPRVFWKVLGAATAAGMGPLVPEAQLSHTSLNRKGKGSEHCKGGVSHSSRGLFWHETPLFLLPTPFAALQVEGSWDLPRWVGEDPFLLQRGAACLHAGAPPPRAGLAAGDPGSQPSPSTI